MNNEEFVEKIIEGIVKRIKDEKDRLFLKDKLKADLNKLSIEDKESILKSTYNLIDFLSKMLFINERELMKKKEECKKVGHTFGEWEKFSTRRIVTQIDNIGNEQKVNTKVNLWCRTCSNCGYIDALSYEPEKITKKREEIIKYYVPKKK